MLSELSFEVTTFKVLHSTKEARCVSDIDQKDRLSWKWQYKWENLKNLGINFESNQIKFIYSEKATKFFEISTLLLSYVVPCQSKLEIFRNFVAFSEYMIFSELMESNHQTTNPEYFLSNFFSTAPTEKKSWRKLGKTSFVVWWFDPMSSSVANCNL